MQCDVEINGEIKTKFIYAMDMLDFNLLKVFEEVVNFIDEAISGKSTNNVLVHWYVWNQPASTYAKSFLKNNIWIQPPASPSSLPPDKFG